MTFASFPVDFRLIWDDIKTMTLLRGQILLTMHAYHGREMDDESA
jgi:hypothetical protein